MKKKNYHNPSPFMDSPTTKRSPSHDKSTLPLFVMFTGMYGRGYNRRERIEEYKVIQVVSGCVLKECVVFFFCPADLRDGENLCIKKCFVESYFDRNQFFTLLKPSQRRSVQLHEISQQIYDHLQQNIFLSARVENKRL